MLASNLCQLWAVIPLNGPVAGVAALPVFAFEVWLAILLIVRGFREPVAEDLSAHSSGPIGSPA